MLVTVQNDKPVPKIIDFGVAKATSQRLTEHTVATELGQLIGTPEYMSPASVLSGLGRYQEAEETYLEAIDLKRRVLGTEHPATWSSVSYLAKTYGTEGRYEEAETLLQAAYRDAPDGVGRRADVAKALVELYEAWPKPDKAAEYRAVVAKNEAPH